MFNNEEFVSSYLKAHPSAGPRDVYKLLYQGLIGNRHILGDIFRSREGFLAEFESAAPIIGEIFEALPGGELVRVNLRPFKAARGPTEALWSAVLLTAKLFQPRIELFSASWKETSLLLAKYGSETSELRMLDELAEQEEPYTVHHSERFRRQENPSYRVASLKAIEGIGGALFELYQSEKGLPTSRQEMPDVANQRPKHEIPIDRVGIERLRYPIVVLDRENRKQHTVADLSMSVGLPSSWRGTHMSRFIELINKYRGEITFGQIKEILNDMLRQFKTQSAHISLEFPYFIEKLAPVSRLKSLMEYKASFDGMIRDGIFDFKLGVEIPATTLCPCSKELCEASAHSQRAYIKIEVKSDDFIWLEELIEIGESAASAPLFATLKREDEKFVTEAAYQNPRFVEDVVRYVVNALEHRPSIRWFNVRASSEESIHNHSAFAQIERRLK